MLEKIRRQGVFLLMGVSLSVLPISSLFCQNNQEKITVDSKFINLQIDTIHDDLIYIIRNKTIESIFIDTNIYIDNKFKIELGSKNLGLERYLNLIEIKSKDSFKIKVKLKPHVTFKRLVVNFGFKGVLKFINTDDWTISSNSFANSSCIFEVDLRTLKFQLLGPENAIPSNITY